LQPALRANIPAFVYGDFKIWTPTILKSSSTPEPSTTTGTFVIHNFSSQPIDYTLPDNMKAGTMLLANYPSHENSSTILHLKCWESASTSSSTFKNDSPTTHHIATHLRSVRDGRCFGGRNLRKAADS